MEPVPSSNGFDASSAGSKRKRSLSSERSPTFAPSTTIRPLSAKHARNAGAPINYLTRHYSDTLPLVAPEDSLVHLVQTLTDYSGVLDRQESLAGNLGARPLGPILARRFERLFDGPPRVIKSSNKDVSSKAAASTASAAVSWLDVVEFARHKPEQFKLERGRDGNASAVCQMTIRQSRVEISEEDFFLVASGMPQRLIPPQPLAEDEEKELGTIEIVERNLGRITRLAEHTLKQARQLQNRLEGRRNGIASRRRSDSTTQTSDATAAQNSISSESRSVSSPTAASPVADDGRWPSSPSIGIPNGVNGNPRSSGVITASSAIKADLLNFFQSQRDQLLGPASSSRPSKSADRNHDRLAALEVGDKSSRSVSTPTGVLGTPTSAALTSHDAATPHTASEKPEKPEKAEKAEKAEKDDGGPYKAEMLSRMEAMGRGERIKPPCDRCRRLNLECYKNLTACIACTKKHCRCSWKDVIEQELLDNPRPPLRLSGAAKKTPGTDSVNDASKSAESTVLPGPPQPVRDEELLGEESDSEERPPTAVGESNGQGAAGPPTTADSSSSSTSDSGFHPVNAVDAIASTQSALPAGNQNGSHGGEDDSTPRASPQADASTTNEAAAEGLHDSQTNGDQQATSESGVESRSAGVAPSYYLAATGTSDVDMSDVKMEGVAPDANDHDHDHDNDHDGSDDSKRNDSGSKGMHMEMLEHGPESLEPRSGALQSLLNHAVGPASEAPSASTAAHRDAEPAHVPMGGLPMRWEMGEGVGV